MKKSDSRFYIYRGRLTDVRKPLSSSAKIKFEIKKYLTIININNQSKNIFRYPQT